MKIPSVYLGDDDEPTQLPYCWEVCPQCQGEGTSSAYLGAFTASEWAEQDHEFREDYLGGRYDRTCETCGGKRVVPEVDEARCTKPMLDAWREQQRHEAYCESERRMEYLMCGGWREEYGY